MPRYHFHVRDGSALKRDKDGQELANVEAARQQAIVMRRKILGEKPLHGGSLDRRSIEIVDETSRVVDVIGSKDTGEQFRSYCDDVTQSAPKNSPPR